MLTIHVCIGSACHIKGSYSVIKGLQKAISDAHLENQVALKGVFCLGHCTKSVSVRINDEEEIYSVSFNDVPTFMQQQILPRLEANNS